MTPDPNHWWIFRGEGEPHDGISRLPDPPPWRRFSDEAKAQRGAVFEPEDKELELVNAAMYLRRPLLITGRAGIGKTTLAYAVARELKLGRVLRWSVTTQSTLREALYRYDAVGRLQETQLQRDAAAIAAARRTPNDPHPGPEDESRSTLAVPITRYLRLGPLGTAFADSAERPRVLLVDEIDKSDLDLPNDLLHLFEEGEFEIPELARLPPDQQRVEILPLNGRGEDRPIPIEGGRVHCTHFPIVFLTSNGERTFPPAFLRRCLQLHMDWPQDLEEKRKKLTRIVARHLDLDPKQQEQERLTPLIARFVDLLQTRPDALATDQLLNASYLALADEQILKAIYLVLKDVAPERPFGDPQGLLKHLWQPLSE